EPAPFAEPTTEPEQAVWTSRRIAGRIIRLSVREARKQAEPIAPIRWLHRTAALQYVLRGTQLQGDEGLLAVIERLQGIFLPLSLWESVIFPSRVSGFRKEQLDLLCAGGDIVWLGRKEPGEREGRIAFFLA